MTENATLTAKPDWPLGVNVGAPLASFAVFVLVCAATYYVDDPGLREIKKRKLTDGTKNVVHLTDIAGEVPNKISSLEPTLVEGVELKNSPLTPSKGFIDNYFHLPSYTRSLGEAERARLKQQMMQERRRRTVSESGPTVMSAPTSPPGEKHPSETTAHLDFVLGRVAPVFSGPKRTIMFQPRRQIISHSNSIENTDAEAARGGRSSNPTVHVVTIDANELLPPPSATKKNADIV